MDKYIGNKKSIVENLEQLMLKKEVQTGIFFDAFSGTTNVGQYFKQRGFDVIVSDSNSFSKVLGDAYVVNNEFPQFEKLLPILKINLNKNVNEELDEMIDRTANKIISDKIFQMDYLQVSNFIENIQPLAKVIFYLNNIDTNTTNEDELFFMDYYTVYGEKSVYRSLRGTEGKRNYFSKYNSIKLGVILKRISDWKNDKLISEMELSILLAAVIEEVTLIANVAGTFHDFNRDKLYPNALTQMNLRIPVLNITKREGVYYAFEGDTNQLYRNVEYNNVIQEHGPIELLYIDPPYNFRQYSDYYHMLNFIADYPKITDLNAYGSQLNYVRGQNMTNSFKSQYSYKDTFEESLKELISNTTCNNIIISYYDENNHWNHGKKEVSNEGRNAIVSALKNADNVTYVEEEPHSVKRLNYQSRKGENKKNIDELFFYGRKNQ